MSNKWNQAITITKGAIFAWIQIQQYNLVNMEHYKSERQRQLDNVQKELLTNYYLQKYNTIMSKITKQPQNHASQVNSQPKDSESKSHRLNFKNMILMKKSDNQNMSTRNAKIHRQPQQGQELVHKYSSKGEQQNKKMMMKLQDSIINELYKPSPSKIEEGTYKKIQINSITSRQNKPPSKQIDLQPILIENIEVTYDQEQDMDLQEGQHQLLFKDQQKIDHIKEAIKLEFDRRKDKSMSPRRNSEAKSSNISMQIKIESPKRLQKSATPHRSKSKNVNFSKEKNRQFNHDSSQSDGSEAEEKGRRQTNSLGKQPQVYFMKEVDSPIDESPKLHYEQQVKQQEQIQFVPPTSTYYKSQNDNLVQQSFKFQEDVRQNRDQDSQKARSIASSRKSSKQKGLLRNESKNSIRSRQKSSSKMQMSFVSKISMLSSEEGYLIKQKIQKQLYDNELGPYQSALYGILQLIDKNPRSGPVYAVGQKTLDDRKIFEEKRIAQQSEISGLRKNIQKLKRKNSQIHLLSSEQKVIRNNQLQILRLIRKISTNL